MQKYFVPTHWRQFATPALLGLMIFTVGCSAAPPDATPTATADTVQSEAAPTATADAGDRAQAVTQLRVGQAAPDFVGVDSLGNTHRLSDFRGKVVVLEWTNHQCPFVRKHYDSGNMQGLQTEAAAEGVVWLSVISSAPGAQGYVEAAQANDLTESRNASPTAILLDPAGEIGRLYDARTTPHMFVINPQGVVEYMGAIDSIPSADQADVATAENYVQAALTNVLTGQPVNPAVTQPYGCSVKYSS